MTADPAAGRSSGWEEELMDWSAVRLPDVDERTVAVVLGGGGAIGGATVCAFAAVGATVVLVTRSAERGAALAKKVAGPGRVLGLGADLTDTESLRRLAADVTDQVGAPSALVNAAAVGAPRTELTDVPRRKISTIFDVNVIGAFEAAKSFVPAMREAGGGRIVNVSSVAAQRVLPGAAPYGSSKAALISLTQHLAVDLAPDGITVNSVSPGQTPTRLRNWDEPPGADPTLVDPNTAVDGIPRRRRGRLRDYVGAILFLCSSLADYITGVDIPVEGGARLVRAKAY
jgi:NAD(P)-dependent dehydrogenase (short-subunit alcohol dehydrogenase family)